MGRFPGSGVIFGYRLEYTHTPKGLPLNCHDSRDVRTGGVYPFQPCEISGLFTQKCLLTKGHDRFLCRIMTTFPLIYINLPHGVNPIVPMVDINNQRCL